MRNACILSSLLGHCTSTSGISAAFKAYDFVRIPRTCKVITLSREQGKLLCFESPEAGSDLEKIAERLDWDRRLWMWDLDVETHFQEALEKFEEERCRGHNMLFSFIFLDKAHFISKSIPNIVCLFQPFCHKFKKIFSFVPSANQQNSAKTHLSNGTLELIIASKTPLAITSGNLGFVLLEAFTAP